MNKKAKSFRYLMTIALLGLITVSAAQAETVNCTPVNSLPAVISSQGVYCLTGNLATNMASGAAIVISANNVTLDLNGWKVGGQAAGAATQAIGIVSAANNVTIKNGIVRGFHDAINLTGRGAVVEDMLVDQNTVTGIYVSGQGSIVRRNHVVDTGGSTVSSNVDVYGILALGKSISVEDNNVSGLAAAGNGYEDAITLGDDDGTARNNIVTDDAKPIGGDSAGIIVGYSAGNTVVDNVITNFTYGIYYDGTGVYSRNTVSGCDTAFSGGTAGSGNDHD
jgi:parallel beta-helix repeat protein